MLESLRGTVKTRSLFCDIVDRVTYLYHTDLPTRQTTAGEVEAVYMRELAAYAQSIKEKRRRISGWLGVLSEMDEGDDPAPLISEITRMLLSIQDSIDGYEEMKVEMHSYLSEMD